MGLAKYSQFFKNKFGTYNLFIVILRLNMGATKSYEFSVKENKLAKYAKALAHPARIAILKILA
ncbi:MAG: hypothetical protein ACXWC7_13275, partial [Chitinophagaceae bacterium]